MKCTETLGMFPFHLLEGQKLLQNTKIGFLLGTNFFIKAKFFFAVHVEGRELNLHTKYFSSVVDGD